ncbi:hypothetical protein KBY74_11665, partial [Cyanobium sp. A1C-AMD]|uniref:hypothetical protein n=1 Tax=Cyanobium sp. A1C-AMD TaxID=2823694 RepID=UPI0020CD26A0
MSSSQSSKLLIKADNAFRHNRWQEALQLYTECKLSPTTENERRRAEIGARISMRHIKNYALPENIDLLPSLSLGPLTEDCEKLLKLAPCIEPHPTKEYIGDVINANFTLNFAVALKLFLQSPWQTSLGLIAQLIV